MSTDVEVIRQLEQEIGVELEQLEGEVDRNLAEKGYQIDANQHVICLYLDDANLKELSRTILELKNLTRLSLYGNQLSTLPSAITQLTNLTQLDVSDNQLRTLPPAITQLTNLTQLDVSDNQLSTLPPAITQLTHLMQLDMSGNQLRTLPPAITQLTNLTQLDVRSNQLHTLPPTITQLTNLTQLDVSDNQLSTLPPAITQLTHLTQLDMSGNQLRTLPPAITQLTNLTQLDVRSNQLHTLPPAITQLTNLTQLDVSDNQLSTLPPAITQLTHLTQLDMSGNQLSTLPPAITQLTNLTQLDVRSNQLSTLPPAITQLTNLTHLDVGVSQLHTLPPEIGQLSNLMHLDVGINQLRMLPSEIGQLANLTELDVRSNQLRTLPPEIGQLTHLTYLDVGFNQLRTLPSEIGQLANLTELDVRSNQLSTLPPEFVRLKELWSLSLEDNNPLKQPPPEIVKQGIEMIFEYLSHENKQIVNEAKLLLVGQGDVGKTCLANRLICDTFQEEKSTEGIDILAWDITAPTTEQEEIKLNVWDFGGQEIYHATHQFFLTKRSVYLLVWNARKSRDYEHIYYWLHTIEAFGEDSPVILVLTKLNERDDDLNLKDLKEQFSQIIDLYKVDSEDAKGIPALKDIIGQTAWNLPQMQVPWIDSWLKVRERLEQDGRNWIQHKDFLQICESEGLSQRLSDILDQYLHDLGVIIHFRDRLVLQNMVILKPEWATDAVYKVLDTQSVRERDGVLLHSELDRTWDTTIYPPDIFPQLLELMNKFELAYRLPDQKSHLIAELLPSTEPDFNWEDSENLRFYYRYDFLPAGVMTRFIVLVHRDLDKQADGHDLCWREGAVLKRDGTRAFVKVRPVEKLIEIRISGGQKRELLAIIRREFDHIHRSIKKIKITQEVPCNCSEGCSHRFNYDQLLKAEERGKNTLDCYVTLDEVSVASLLDGYERKADRVQDADKLNELLELASEKLFSLEKARITETNESAKFQLEKQIAELIEERQRIESQLARMKSKAR